MHPDDAARLGRADGAEVTLRNDRADVTLILSVSDATLPGVLYSPKGTWRSTSDTGLTVNALIPSHIRTDIERGACYHETYVDVIAR
jgi:anaerobic selenocysteine-containing dehydrogenase